MCLVLLLLGEVCVCVCVRVTEIVNLVLQRITVCFWGKVCLVLLLLCVCEGHRNCEFGITVDYSVFLR